MKNYIFMVFFCFISCSLAAMDNPTREIRADMPGVFLKDISSNYKRPIILSLMNVAFDPIKKRFMAGGGRSKPLARVQDGEILVYDRHIPLIQGDGDSQACLIVEDLTDENEFGTIWLSKRYTAQGCTFGSPKIADSMKTLPFTKEQRTQTLLTLKFNDLNKLSLIQGSRIGGHTACVEFSSKTMLCS